MTKFVKPAGSLDATDMRQDPHTKTLPGDRTISSSALSQKELTILDGALAILAESGGEGLTMRKLADRSGMHLSNVQYYFRSRDDVLKAMVARYFGQCTDALVAHLEQSRASSPRDRMYFLVEEGLSHGAEISDLCRTFRELWAISSRNASIHACLMNYYRDLGDRITGFVMGQPVNAELRKRLMTLLVPYFEGYSVTAPAMPLSADQTAEMLTDLAMSILTPPS